MLILFAYVSDTDGFVGRLIFSPAYDFIILYCAKVEDVGYFLIVVKKITISVRGDARYFYIVVKKIVIVV